MNTSQGATTTKLSDTYQEKLNQLAKKLQIDYTTFKKYLDDAVYLDKNWKNLFKSLAQA